MSNIITNLWGNYLIINSLIYIMGFIDSDIRRADTYNSEYQCSEKGDGIDISDKIYEHFWKSQLYLKSYFTKHIDNKKFRYYDKSNFTKFLFFGWVTDWTKYIAEDYIEPYKLHPLPVSDQILRWQPIFSKHVSDGLVRLESYQTLKSKGEKIGRNQYPYKSLLLRASLLTFWKRTLFVLFCIVIINILSLSISFLVQQLTELLTEISFNIFKIIMLFLLIIFLTMFDVLIKDNISFSMYRLVYIIQYSFSIATLQHGLSHRRLYSNNIEGSNSLGTCNKILHSCDSGSECTKNPLFCPGLRHQNIELTPNIFTFQFSDSYYISMFLESLSITVDFLSSFIYGMFLISYQVKIRLWILYVIGLVTVVSMVLIEMFNTLVLKMIFKVRDYRISKCIEIFPSLGNINKSFYDDIAINILTETRNNELSLFLLRIFLTYFNTTLYVVCINVSFYLLIRNFVKSIDYASIITDIDTSGFLTTLYILIQVIDSMFKIPRSFTKIANAIVSFNRIGCYINSCSPNFYISDNRFTGSTNMSLVINDTTNDLDKDVVVLYKNATFAWVSSRNDLLNKNYQIFLEDVNFQIKRGEIAIVTGVLGSGKSNFIKSVLGEMTLVGGSMAVVPLYTSMPIFYASQDIWIEKGTIRSNITFSYRFDSAIYETVLKSLELQYDISTWEKGDMRVVSDNALSLSGGQRVRMEMARALYAYLIFNQVNKQYNNSRCSFLMCLDSSFDGLDPFVSKTVFNNLFNAKSGIIVKDDLAVVLSSSKQSLNKCLSQSDLKQFPNIPVYQVKNKRLTFHCYILDYFSGNLDSAKYQYFSKTTVNQNINYLTPELFDRCLSASNKRLGRKLETISKYEYSFKSYIEQTPGKTFNPYIVYLTPAMVTFTIFILLTLALTILDNLKFVLASNLSDYITKCTNDFNDGEIIDLSAVKSKSDFYLSVVVIFISIIMASSLMSSVLFSFACVISSRKIHEYCINSIFKNSSSVIKIKNQTTQILTYLSSDIDAIDDDICYDLYLSFVSFTIMLINVFTMFYLIPISIPFVIVTLFMIFKLVMVYYIMSYKNLQFGYLESISQINDVFEKCISGPSIYRSFKKEWELLHNNMEHNEYFMRHFLFFYSIASWASILFNWLFCLNTFIMIVLQITFHKYLKLEVNAGQYALFLSLIVEMVKNFGNFSTSFANIEAFMCSVKRLQYFVPPGVKCVFGKYINIHEEDLVVNPSHDVYKITKKQLLKRRSNEFNENNTEFNCFKRMFYKPKINIIDVTQYLPEEHKGLGLHSVFVHTSPDVQNEKGIILNNITASAYKSDIIGIIGRTGAGKTTLLSVLESTARNRTGKVLLDGMDLNDIPKNVTKHIIGVLPQLPFVFKGWTLRRFLDPRKLFSDEEINKALESCGLLEFVNDLQGGKKLDSVIINDLNLSKSNQVTNINTNRLSKFRVSINPQDLNKYYFENQTILCGDQLRTLAFAKLVLYRYFYRIIIIDEPPEDANDETDSTRQRVIQTYELLEKYFKHCTCFVTAHDASVLKSCTSVWVIHNGCLVKICKREEIPANDSISNIIEESVKYYKI